jgi:hypothetical protein
MKNEKAFTEYSVRRSGMECGTPFIFRRPG